jgi:carboxypeptidase T
VTLRSFSQVGRILRAVPLAACLIVAVIAGKATAYTFPVGLYQSFSQMTTWATDLATTNPDIVNLVNYGTTTGGRPLLALNITVNPAANDPNKPEFLFAAGIHAREVIGSQSAYSLAEYLVKGYRNNDATIRNILSTRDVWIIPNQNPDGRVVVEGGYSDQRKNDHWYSGQPTTGSNWMRGVDLNRNYPHKWILASSDLIDETYRGPSVLSEPEASGLWNLLHDKTRFSHLLAAIDIHSGAATILAPWTSPTDFNANPLPAADRAKFDSLAGRMSQLTGYSTARLSYDSYGTLTDSLYQEFGTYAVLEESYMGPSTDYFTLFNPTDQATRDATVNKVIASSMYLLSDEAFAVPEPSVVVLLAGGAVLLLFVALRRRRIGVCRG